MIADLNQAPIELKNHDVCIAGAGPAGITLALSLANKGMQVLLLEAGGLEFSAESQALYECDSSARQLWAKLSRLRYLGGSSNHWAGRCRPFEAADFISTRGNDFPGWPIDYSAISAYLPAAMKILDLPAAGFSAAHDDFLDNRFDAEENAQSPPTRFGDKYRNTLKINERITVVLNANLTELIAAGVGSRVTTARAVNYSGAGAEFSARVFILALGGIDNARLLLNQHNLFAGSAEANYQMLGKGFMEHMNVKIGEFIVTEPERAANFQFVSAQQLIARQATGGAAFAFSNVSQIRSYGRSAKIKTFFKTLACDLGLEKKVDFIARFDCPGTGVISSLIEQSPSQHSYIGLSDEVDAIGLKKAVINWEINDYDKRTIRSTSFELAQAFAESGMGLIKLEPYIVDDTAFIPIGRHAHHMGSTRMASRPKFGVVDRDCKVFGFDNLYIAGSSIFATGGFCNPTLPLIQFALRLVDHLDEQAA